MGRKVNIKIILIIVIFLICPFIYGDILGDVSISKDAETYKGNIKIGYDFEMGDITLIPFIDYVNYFRVKELSGFPFRDIYGVGVKVEYKNIYLTVKHSCTHEVSSLNSRDKPVLYSDAEVNKSSTWVTVGYKWGKGF